MLRITNTRSDDDAAVRRLTGYLASNKDDGVRTRPDDLIRTALSTGLALEVDDDSDDGELHACSLIYRFDGERAFSEIGTQRVTLNGLGLQVLLASLHLVQLRHELFDEDATTFAVVAPGTPSEHNLVDVVGMTAWEPPRPLVEARAAAGVAFMDGKSVIAAGETAIAKAFAAMRRWHVRDRLFRCPKTDATIRIDCGWFDPTVLTIG